MATLSPQVVSHKARIEMLIRTAKTLDPFGELQAHLTKYICVLTSGLLEVAVRSTLTTYASKKGAPRLVRYIERDLAQFQNPKMNKILDLIRKFDVTWADELRSATEGELKDAVDSVVANRHQIAHGSNVGMSITQVEDYYRRIARVIDLIADSCM